ncbi:MAG: hypothetical protein ABI703_05655, partial [Gemmatimonadales bacterium]
MQSQKALIERTNRQALKQVEVRVTITDSGSGHQSWRGEFMSRTADGFRGRLQSLVLVIALTFVALALSASDRASAYRIHLG